ncbi:MobV family relaxase [Vibrio splendidus]
MLRFEKVKSLTAINLSDSHIYRFSYTPNANPERTPFNRVLIGRSGLSRNIQRVFNNLEVKPRKNAVLAMDCILSLSNEAFESKSDIDNFCKAAKLFLKDTFKGRCISAVLHLDETTPHIHAMILPLNRKGDRWTLNARDMFSKTKLSRYQKSYYSHMKKEFSKLCPPNYGSKAKHKDIKKIYFNINKLSSLENKHVLRDKEVHSIYDEVYEQTPARNNMKFR